MNIETWKEYIDNNINSNKLEVIDMLLADKNINKEQYEELLTYIRG